MEKLAQSEFRNQWCTRQEAAVLLGVSLPIIDKYRKSGKLTGYKFGGRKVRLKFSQIKNLLKPETI